MFNKPASGAFGCDRINNNHLNDRMKKLRNKFTNAFLCNSKNNVQL
jgi:hypothetical protein